MLSEEAAKREKARSVSRLEWQVYSQPLLDSFLNIHKHKQVSAAAFSAASFLVFGF